MRKLVFASFLIFVGLGIGSCVQFDTVWLHKRATRCDDPWNDGKDLIERGSNVESYLEGKGITVYEVEVKRLYSSSTCLECHCFTAERISVRVDEEKSTEMEALGFGLN